MHIKFSGGRASAGRAAAYLTGELDSHGEERAAVIVLRGDPELVAAVADGLEFAHTYTSGVLAWAPEDHPTAAHISAVLDEFEATAWAGLDPDRYAWDGRAARRARGGCARPHPGRPRGSGDRQKPQHRAARLGAGL